MVLSLLGPALSGLTPNEQPLSLLAGQLRQQQAQPQAQPQQQPKRTLADRFETLLGNPLFQTGASILASGNVGQGLLQGSQLNQISQAQRAEAQRAQAEALQKSQQQEFENALKLNKFGLDVAEFERGPSPTSLERNLIAAGFQPGTPEFQQAVLSSVNKPLASVQVSGEQQTEFAKALGRQQGEKFATMQSEATEAQNQLNSLAQLEQILESGAPTGPIAQASLPLRQFASDLGVNVDNERIAQQETFRTITNQLALRLRNPESGLGLTGNTSDRDVRFLKQSVPGLEKTEAGNRLIIEFARRAADRKVQAATLAEQYVEQTGGLTGFSSFLRDWAQQNPLFTEEDEARVEAAKSQPRKAPERGTPIEAMTNEELRAIVEGR